MIYLREIYLKRESVSDWSAYPYAIPAIKHLDRLSLNQPVTFIIGENGTGKSTILEALAIKSGFNVEGGSRNMRFTTREAHSALYDDIVLVKEPDKPADGYFLRAESFFNVATEIETRDPSIIQYYGGVSLHEKSHGEAFFTLFMERFFGNGLYLLDEPEAALSPQRQLAFLARLHDLVKLRSQFIIATHSPVIMAYPGARIYQLETDGIGSVRWEETEHYRLTKDFLNNPQRMFRHLEIEPPAD